MSSAATQSESSHVFMPIPVSNIISFIVHHATALVVDVVSGDMYAGPRPVPCTITVTSGAGTGSEATASMTLDLVNEDVYTYPFSAFTGVDFTDVDYITYNFDASQVQAVDFAIGPLTTDVKEVGVEESTWGTIKSMYR